jgi:hypothetical protein
MYWKRASLFAVVSYFAPTPSLSLFPAAQSRNSHDTTLSLSLSSLCLGWTGLPTSAIGRERWSKVRRKQNSVGLFKYTVFRLRANIPLG